jgi:hypothetical protein
VTSTWWSRCTFGVVVDRQVIGLDWGGPQATLFLGQEPLGWLGIAELIDEGADDHVDVRCEKYFDVDTFPYRRPDDIRVIVKVMPYHRAMRNSDPPKRRTTG